MAEAEETKEFVRKRYAAIVEGRPLPAASCCGSGEFSVMAQSYDGIEGHAAEADLNLGCGIPTAFASLQPGEVVVDLGSGAGNDAFISARAVGKAGRVIGVDMTPAMIEKARSNAAKLGAGNVEFRMGEIEALPLEDGIADVVISNCVLNLVPDKRKAFEEIYRILKPGGRFAVSDIVSREVLPEEIRRSAELWCGCVAGALEKSEYLSLAREAGFRLSIEKERPIAVPGRPEIDSVLVSLTLSGFKEA